MPLIAGVDCSTQSTKVLVIDADSGDVVAAGQAANEVTGTDGARETDPAVWWQGLSAALDQTDRAGEVAAIAFGGQQHGLVVCDDDGRPLRPSMLWNDTRSAAHAQQLVEAFGPQWWAKTTGSVPVASYTVSKWAWLRDREPEVAAQTRRVRLPHDWLTEQLTGEAVTDRGDASGTGWWSTADEAYSDRVLEHVGLDGDLLPRVAGPFEAVGQVTSAAADALGLPAGIPVGPGTGDNMAAALGLGAREGVPVLSLGTSGVVHQTTASRPGDPTGIVSGFADASGRFLPLACTLNCTLAVDRVAHWLGLDREAISEGTSVTLLPFLDGERTPNLPHASGAMLGLRHDTSPGDILLAAYEGAAASLVSAMDAIAAQAGAPADDAPLILIGGGARGGAWRQVIGRMTGRELLIPSAQELVAIGAAVQAAVVLSGDTVDDVVDAWDPLAGDRIDPAPVDASPVERIHEASRRLFEDA